MSITAVPLQPTPRRVMWKLWSSAWLVAALFGGWLAFAGTAAVVADRGSNAQFLAWNKGRAGRGRDRVGTAISGAQGRRGHGQADRYRCRAGELCRQALRTGDVFDQNQRTPMPVGGMIPGFSEGLKLMSKGVVTIASGSSPSWAMATARPIPPRSPTGRCWCSTSNWSISFPSRCCARSSMQQMHAGAPGGAPGNAGARHRCRRPPFRTPDGPLMPA